MTRLTIALFFISTLMSITYNSTGQKISDTAIFISPVDIPIRLSGNFGEIRGTHFHTGIDIKTQGVEGKNIYAIADGYVSRIKVSSGGYGNAIYITHPNGYVSVYGHLQSFVDDINQYVTNYQYKKKKFAVNIFPPKDMFQVHQGEMIGLSGNSGSSMGPHLHFEIRNSSDEHPVNPILFNFDIEDTIKPKIYSISIYPLDAESHVNNHNRKQNLKARKANGKYIINSNSPVLVYGSIGFGIECNDFLNGSHNKCGVYTINLMVDSNLVYSTNMSELDFSEQGYVKSHIDYETKVESKKTIQKSFIDPNNKSSIYKFDLHNGIININDTLIHDITFTLTDVHKNKSSLDFKVKGLFQEWPDSLFTEPEYIKAMPYGIENTYINENIDINIPANSLFKDLFFTYSTKPKSEGSFSRIHSIHKNTVPVLKSFKLKIAPDSLPSKIKDKLVIAQLIEDKGSTSLISYSGKWEDEFLYITTKDFGDYGIFADTIPPEISLVNIYNGKDMTGKKSIKLLINDDFSGISKYEVFIDNEWVLFRYDAKNNLIYYTFSDNRITTNTNHKLEIRVYDNVDNIAEAEIQFYF